MLIAHHLVWTAYGSWLPNDPRGSMSHSINRDVLKEFGDPHYGRKRIQPRSQEIRTFYEQAKDLLHYPILQFNEEEIQAVGASFAHTIQSERYTCYACAIMPDHVHLVVRKHRDRAEEMIAKLQVGSCVAVRSGGTRDKFHPVWGGCGWKVFLNSTNDVWRTVKYVGDNPVKARLRRQTWGFVTAYDNWPLHRRNSGAPGAKPPSGGAA